MSTEIIEKSCISKYEDESRCEDGLFISPDYIAVVDGVTSKGKYPWPGGRTSGRYARDILLTALATLPGDADARSAIGILNAALAKACAPQREMLAKQREDRPQAAVILYSVRRREIWAFGDCQCLIGDQFYDHSKSIDNIVAEMRCFYNQTELLDGKTTEELLARDTGRAFILPLLRRQLVYANGEGPYAYDILDGFPIHPERIIVHPVPAGTQVVLASDGYPQLKGTLKETEEVLSQVLTEDPLCISLYKGTKGLVKGNRSFDDRTYVRFVAG